MSVFGGDSWAREAQHRKRRLDDFLLSSQPSSSSYKKLSNGKLACLICTNAPILDSPLMLSMHCKGSRHIAAEERMRKRELDIQAEMSKRIALSSPTVTPPARGDNTRSRKGDDVASGAERSERSQVDDVWWEERRKRREKELEFTAAGWKRDGYGRWYRDENVEFDSDEEDPSVYFA